MNSPAPADFAHALDLLNAGALVALPTETVYGLGADASNPDAVAKIFAAKGRPADHPLIVHLANAEAATGGAVAAVAEAQQAAALLQPGQYFLDLNSVAPETKRQAAEHFLPGAYIDVAVMAPVPPARLQTPLLIGGPQAEAIAPRLQGLGLNARYGASTVGQVSAIKMCRSVMIKGLEALTTECLFAAREYGVEEEVLSSLHHSFPSLGWTGAFPDYLISRVAEHGIRRSEEMEEVVKTLRDVGSAGIMSEAIAKSQRQLPEQMAARSLSYRQLTPFDWKTLVARLK